MRPPPANLPYTQFTIATFCNKVRAFNDSSHAPARGQLLVEIMDMVRQGHSLFMVHGRSAVLRRSRSIWTRKLYDIGNIDLPMWCSVCNITDPTTKRRLASAKKAAMRFYKVYRWPASFQGAPTMTPV